MTPNTVKSRVLVVDDDDFLRETLVELLSIMGFAAEAVSSAESARAKLTGDPGFSIVITDVRMPGENGISLLRWIRESLASQPRVYVISGFTDHTESEVLAAGADGFLAKPFTASTLKGLFVAAQTRK